MPNAENTAPSLRVIESDELDKLAALLVISRPRRPGQVMVVFNSTLTSLQLMTFANVLLPADERDQLADWLEIHRGVGGSA